MRGKSRSGRNDQLDAKWCWPIKWVSEGILMRTAQGEAEGDRGNGLAAWLETCPKNEWESQAV